MKHIFKPGRYKTRDGREAVVLCDDAPGDWPLIGYIVARGEAAHCSWTASGLATKWPGSPSDLIPPAPEQVVRFVSLYADGYTGLRYDATCAHSHGNAIASARVVLTPGVFEDENTPSEYDRGWNDAIDAAKGAVMERGWAPVIDIIRTLKRSAP